MDSTNELDPVAASSRRLFLKRSTALALAGGTAALLAGNKVARADDDDDAREGRYPGAKSLFLQIRAHEASHVDFLVAALGNAARPKPTFKGLLQNSFEDFATVAQSLENTGCGAYLAAAPFINSQAYLSAAGSIALIEGRHAGWLNTFNGDRITGNVYHPNDDGAFEDPLKASDVAELAGPFVKSLNGGPALTYARSRSDANDIAILNFALALEYLEAEFYRVNARAFF